LRGARCIRASRAFEDSKLAFNQIPSPGISYVKKEWFADSPNGTAWNPIQGSVLKKLFEQHFHAPPERIQPLQVEIGGRAARSSALQTKRSAYRHSLWRARRERRFLEFSKTFSPAHGLPGRERKLCRRLSHGAYLEEDLGDTTLFEFFRKTVAGGKH